MALITPETHKKSLEIPHEPGEWVEVMPLSGAQKEEAQQATLDRAYGRIEKIPRDLIKEIRDSQGREEDAGPGEPEMDGQYLLEHSVVAWSYKQPPTPQMLVALDAKTREWLIGELKALNCRDDAEKKGSDSPSSPASSSGSGEPEGAGLLS